jgi:hypothetical protein
MASGSKNDGYTDADAVAALQHAEMKQTQDYLERGRALAQQTDEQVKSVWAATFERHFAEPTKESARNMDDASAELRLRKIELPLERVQETFDALQAEIKKAGPDAFEGLDEEIDEFLAARAKPKN